MLMMKFIFIKEWRKMVGGFILLKNVDGFFLVNRQLRVAGFYMAEIFKLMEKFMLL